MVLTTTVSAPAWSPDGSRLAFAKNDDDELALYTIAADGSDVQRLIVIKDRHAPFDYLNDRPSNWPQTVEWSPSGELILYACGRYVCVVKLDGVQVGRTPRKAYTASWSPDGTRIVVGSPDVHEGRYAPPPVGGGIPEVLAVYTMAPDGSDVQPVAISTKNGVFRGARGPIASSPVDVAGCATGAVVPDPAANPGLVNDCKVLLALRDRLAGSAALNWSADRPISEWDGVRRSGSPSRVTHIFLGDEGLSGVLPAELAELSELEALVFQYTFLTGSIPPELGELTKLGHLNISASLLTGEIPATLARLSNLTELNLHGNQLSGKIPPELGQLPNLQLLALSANELTGPIPPELGNLRSLESLILHENQLSGEIPAELGQLSNLRELHLDNNQLTGEIPRTLAGLENLTLLGLNKNRLSGEIPLELSHMPDLQWVYLSGNDLGGCIPTGLRVRDREDLGLRECDEKR